MPRRRFTLRLHHGDAALMLLAVLVATAFCWVVVAFTQGRPRPGVAYMVEALGLTLSQEATSRLLQETLKGREGMTATLVRDTRGVSIGVVSLASGPDGLAAAQGLAEAFATRLRDTDWSATDAQRADELADQLYQLDVRIRDASARRDANGPATAKARLAASLDVSRLLRRRSELLANQRSLFSDQAGLQVSVQEHQRPPHATAERRAALTLFGVLIAAAVYRLLIGRWDQNARALKRLGAPPEAVRPRRGLVLASAAVFGSRSTDQPRAA